MIEREQRVAELRNFAAKRTGRTWITDSLAILLLHYAYPTLLSFASDDLLNSASVATYQKTTKETVSSLGIQALPRAVSSSFLAET